MPNRKFGRASDQRAAILKNQVTALIINGKLELTVKLRQRQFRLITLHVSLQERP